MAIKMITYSLTYDNVFIYYLLVYYILLARLLYNTLQFNI